MEWQAIAAALMVATAGIYMLAQMRRRSKRADSTPTCADQCCGCAHRATLNPECDVAHREKQKARRA